MLSIIIPNYRKHRYLEGTLDSLFKANLPEGYEIIFVDDGSPEQEELESYIEDWKIKLNIKFTKIAVNQGFANTCNFGATIAEGDILLFLNNDVIVEKDFITEMLKVLENVKANIVGCKILNPKDGRVIHAGIIFNNEGWPHEIGKGINVAADEVSTDREMNAVTAACMMIRKSDFIKLHGFNTDFKNGWEDNDFCYDKKTEIITENGIRLIKDICLNDRILTLRDDGEMEYRKVTNIIKKYEKKLLHFKSRRIDIMCSFNQDLLVGYCRKERNQYKDIDFIKADIINKKLWKNQTRYFVKKNGGFWKGKKKESIRIANRQFNIKDFVLIMAWYLSEGCVYLKNKRHYEIIISQCGKKYRTEIINIIKRIGFKPNKFKDKITFSNKELCIYLARFGHANKKFIPNEIKELSKKYLELFLLTYTKGDGSFKKNNSGVSLVTSSIQMKDDLIELILKTGNTFSIYSQPEKLVFFPKSSKKYLCKPIWQIQVYYLRKEKAFIPLAKLIDYNDFTYDIEVPNHRIYIIRNGKGCWSSNCLRTREMGMKIVYSSKAIIYHWISKSEGRMAKEKENRDLYRRLWIDSGRVFQITRKRAKQLYEPSTEKIIKLLEAKVSYTQALEIVKLLYNNEYRIFKE